jgi:aminoglycoside phosphotransferase (APT) family kinase protein
LIASGRDGDIFEHEHDPGLVLRVTRDGRSLAREARVMAYAAEHGYPVPAVHELRAKDTELVMERIDGPMMMDRMFREPWALPRYMQQLADLHDALHEITGPPWLAVLHDGGDPSGGDRLVHLDLHPANVMLAARGPVVIDWTNAARGEGLVDVAVTYSLLTCPNMPGPPWVRRLLQPVRLGIGHSFARRYRGRAFDERLAFAADLKALDTNMAPDEVAQFRRLAERSRQRAAAGSDGSDGPDGPRWDGHPV